VQKLLVVLVLFVVFAGCVGNSPAAEIILTDAPEPGYGAIAGRLVDDELRPLALFPITLVEIAESRISDDDGSFFFDRVPEGNYTLVATNPEYADVIHSIQIDAGQTVDVKLTASKLPEYRPYNVTIPLRGQYDCAAEYFIITGHCGILWEYTTCAAQSCQPDPVFTQNYQFPLDIQPRWETVVAELTWTAAVSNGLAGMRLYVENTNVTEQAGHSVKVARAQGDDQPLYIRIDRGVIRPEAETYNNTAQQAFIPDEGGRQQIRVFPMGQGYDVTSQACLPSFGCFLGVGAGAGVQFDLLITIFYNENAPESFSAAPQ